MRFVAETDSLNSSVLGCDAKSGTPEFDLFIREVVREMTDKQRSQHGCIHLERTLPTGKVGVEPARQTVLGAAVELPLRPFKSAASARLQPAAGL